MRTRPVFLILAALLGLFPVRALAQHLTPAGKKRLEDALTVLRSEEAPATELRSATSALTGAKGPAAHARLLLEAEKTDNERVLYWTCRVLVEAKNGKAASVLVERVGKPGKLRSPRIIELAGRTGDRRAVQPLIKIARSSEPSRSRSAALKALARLNDPDATKAIVEALGDDEYYVRRTANESVAALASAPGRADAVARLVAGRLRTVEKSRRPSLVHLLGKMDCATARREVIYHLGSNDPGILDAAVRSAGELKMADAAERLLEIAEDDDQPRQMREVAFRALGQTGATEDLDELVPLLESEKEFVRKGAHRTLRRLTGKALPPSPDVWSSAVIVAEDERAAGGPIEFDPKELPATSEPQSAADVALAGPPTNPLYYVLAAAAVAAVVGLFALRTSLVRRKTVKIEAGRRKIRRRSS